MTLAVRTLRGTALLAAPLVVLAVLAHSVATPADLRVVVNFMISLVLVLAIQSFSGNSGIVSFGHIAFMGVGAYVAAILTIDPAIKQDELASVPDFIASRTLPFVPAVLLGGLVGAIVAGALGLALSRMRETAMAMATIGVLVIFSVIFDNWEGVTRGNTGVSGIPRSTTVYSALLFAVLAIAACRVFRESRRGLQLRASRTDPLAAEALGVNVIRLRWLAWTLSGGIMGAGGALFAQYSLAFGPAQFSFDQTFSLLAMLVLGGIATVSGAVIGVIVVTIVFEITRRLEDSLAIPGLTQMVVALLILLVLFRRPDGVMGLSEADDALARLRARFARRGAEE